MYFRIDEGTELNKQLLELKERSLEANNKASELVKSVGGENYVTEFNSVVYQGGVSSIEFPEGVEIPKDWVKNKNYSNGRVYYPHSRRKSTKEFREKINLLPLVKNSDFQKIIGMNGDLWEEGNGRRHVLFKPNHIIDKRFSLVHYPEYIKPRQITIMPDMIEITRSEHEALYDVLVNSNSQ